jgi:hypothetical protein
VKDGKWDHVSIYNASELRFEFVALRELVVDGVWLYLGSIIIML